MDMVVSCPSCGAGNRVPAARLHQASRCGRCKAQLGPPRRPLPVASTEEFDELLQGAQLPVLVDYWAQWCGPCRMVAPELEKLAEAQHGRLIVGKVDTEALPDVAGRYGIRSIPTLILFREGRESQRLSGAMPASAMQRELGL